MAEHELNKIVDDDGEVFNLRDSTKQPTSDRVTSWSSTTSDTKYPSEKLVKDSLDGKQATLSFDGTYNASTNKAATVSTVTNAINGLDVSSVGGSGKYISAISETDGKISATATTMDTAPTANSTNAVTSGGIFSALDGKVSRIQFSQPAEYKSFVVIEDVTQWYDPDGTRAISKGYQMIGQLAFWRAGFGSDRMGVAFIKFHLNYRWQLNNELCFEMKTTLPTSSFRPMIIKDARDENNIKYYFGLKVDVAWINTVQFIGRTRDLNFSNLVWIEGKNSTQTGDGTNFPTGITVERGCDVIELDVKNATDATYASNAKSGSNLQNVLDYKVGRTTFSVTVPANTTKYISVQVSYDMHTYLMFFNGTQGVLGQQYLFRTYGSGGTSRTSVNYIGRSTTVFDWYVAGGDGREFLIKYENNSSGQQSFTFAVVSLDGSTLPTIELKDSVPEGWVSQPVSGVVKAQTLTTARTIRTNLASTSTASFDGSANVTPGVTGTLPLGNGGTGKTTAKAAEYNLTTGKSEISDTTSGDDRVVFELASPSESNGVTRGFRKLSTIWTWIKGLLSSESGVNISGNAATATAFSSGTAKTKFDGIAEGATKVEASTTNGKVKINGTDTTVYTHPTSSGNKHVPSGGSSGQFLGWSADGTAAWSDLPKDYTTLSPSSAIIRAYKRYTIGKTNVNLSSANSVRATALIRIHVNYNDDLANSQVAEGMLITMLADICFRTGSLAEMRLDIIGESRWDYSKIRPVLVSFGITEDGITKYVIAIGFGDGTNGTTLQAFDYSYIDVMPLFSNDGWYWMNEGDNVGTYDYIAQAVRETGARLGTAVGSSKLPVYVNDKGEFAEVTASSTATELLCALPAWTATPTDSTYLVRRDTGGAASYGQVTFETVWNYIKGKMSSDPSGVLNGRVSGFTSNIWGTGAKRISLGYANMSATDSWYNAIFLLKTGYNATIGDGRSIALMISYCHRSTGRRVSARVLVNNGWPLSLIPGVFTLETDNNTKLVVGVGVRDSNNDFVNLQYSEFNVVVLGKEESWTDNVTSDSVNACDHWFPTAQQPDIIVVDELPSSPDSNKIYFV